MPEVQTRYFGVISCQEDALLVFPQGLPAFETARRFVLIEQPATSPVVFLQCFDDSTLCFVAIPVMVVAPGYRLGISPEDLRLLGLEEATQPRIGPDVACLAILSVSENRPPTANLLAPVVINLRTRVAIQAIRLDTAYSHEQPLAMEGAPCS
jgi:flagellar assembly factor FliW